MILTWNGSIGFISNSTGNSALNVKPVLSFSYNALYFETDTDNVFRVLDGINYDLTIPEAQEVSDFITNYDFSYLTKHYVDANGKYVGYGLDNGVTEVPSAPPLDANYYWNVDKWTYVHAVDINGIYLGNVEISADTILVASGPNTSTEIWDGAKWTESRDVQSIIDEGKVLIDEAAGKARAKYITAVPGQSETYAEKAKQAEAYTAATTPAVADYPLVNAEFNAMFAVDATATPDDAAAYILATRDQWLILAASIEEERRKGKNILSIQTVSDDAVAHINTVIAALGAL